MELEVSDQTLAVSRIIPFGPIQRNWCNSCLTLKAPVFPDHALYDLAAAVVRRIQPHAEADPAAIDVQLLTGLGDLIGATSR